MEIIGSEPVGENRGRGLLACAVEEMRRFLNLIATLEQALFERPLVETGAIHHKEVSHRDRALQHLYFLHLERVEQPFEEALPIIWLLEETKRLKFIDDTLF